MQVMTLDSKNQTVTIATSSKSWSVTIAQGNSGTWPRA
jgi:hypothetical protein